MAVILADVGGTNVRMTCVRGDVIDPSRTRHFENDAFDSFDAVLSTYLESLEIPRVDKMVVAVAGLVSGFKARLTNRNWSFDASKLGRAHGASEVHLINDLSALGYALDRLGEDDLEPLLVANPTGSGRDQRLVVGVGTGFNVSPVLTDGTRTLCQKAEAGLGSLPTRVGREISGYLNSVPDWVGCVEDVLSGPGLARLHAAATNAQPTAGRDVIVSATNGDAAAQASLQAFAWMLGQMVLDLRLLYMPAGGIYLAGSVARGLLNSSARSAFLDTVRGQPTAKSSLPDVSVSLITRDEAALLGCLAYAQAE